MAAFNLASKMAAKLSFQVLLEFTDRNRRMVPRDTGNGAQEGGKTVLTKRGKRGKNQNS